MASTEPTTQPAAEPLAPADSFELVSLPLPTLEGRERSIPCRTGDLVRLLLADPSLTPIDRTRLEQLARMLGAVFHYEFADWLNQLKELYAPIDPDTDCVRLGQYSTSLTDDADEAFLAAFETMMMRANYVPLTRPILEQAISAPNDLGLDYVPDLKQFEHLNVYVRGQCKVTRYLRPMRAWFRRKAASFDAYRRVVIALKYRPEAELDEYVRSDVVYLRMFKDVPFVEMDMHLPEQGTKIRMRWIDKLQIASPVMTGLPTLAAKVLFEATLSPMLIGLVLFAPISAGVKSFFGYRTARTRYLHKMIRHLYYLTLANNASVINRLIDSGEEEELKEALLAYFMLWCGRHSPEPWDQPRLDAAVEGFLRDRAGIEVDFEIGDALNKLFRLGLVQRNGQGRLLPATIDQALTILDQQWDNYFRFGPPESSRRRKR